MTQQDTALAFKTSGREPQPVYRKDDNELLGYLLPTSQPSQWVPATLFSYPLSEACSEDEAIRVLQDIGLDSLLDRWEFFDSEHNEWFACTIVEAAPDRVKITISDFGHPDLYKARIISQPDTTNIRWTKRGR